MKFNEATVLEKEKHMIKVITNLNHTKNTEKMSYSSRQACLKIFKCS
ncbi:MAG: hypothetical protein RR063_12620 [Anaerovoracaceae bacterium]